MSQLLAVEPVENSAPVNVRDLRPLLGRSVVLRTPSAQWRGTLLSCVRDSAWLIVGDDDVVLRLDDIVAVHAT